PFSFLFFNDPATPDIYTLSLHDALPIWLRAMRSRRNLLLQLRCAALLAPQKVFVVAGINFHATATDLEYSRCQPIYEVTVVGNRSEEHTSELQSRSDLVCRLLLEKKKKK